MLLIGGLYTEKAREIRKPWLVKIDSVLLPYSSNLGKGNREADGLIESTVRISYPAAQGHEHFHSYLDITRETQSMEGCQASPNTIIEATLQSGNTFSRVARYTHGILKMK